MGLSGHTDLAGHTGIIDCHMYQPGTVHIRGLKGAGQPSQPACLGQAVQGRRDHRSDQNHLGAGVEQGGHPPGGHGTSADNQHPAAGQHQPEQVRRHPASAPIASLLHMWPTFPHVARTGSAGGLNSHWPNLVVFSDLPHKASVFNLLSKGVDAFLQTP